MATIITKLFRDGVLNSSVEFDEITYTSVKISPTGVYSSEFDEVTMQGELVAERKSRDGKLFVSGYFDEVTFITQPVDPEILITPATIPDLISNSPYSTTITASGGTEPYTYTLESGSLPEGLTLNSNGTLTGSVYLDELAISPSLLNDAINNSPYSATITASGGTTPYIYSLESGSLPTGLTLNPDGTITGTPTI